MEKMKIFRYNFFGLIFARFRISTLKKQDSNLIGSIEIFPDDISKEAELEIDKKKMVINLRREMKIYYECKLKHHEAEIKKKILEQEKSINKIIFRCCSELDLSIYEKLKLLQLSRQDIKIESLLSHLSTKTEKIKSVLDLEEKVRQDMLKSTTIKKPAAPRIGGHGKSGDNEELEERIKNKKLPPHVREEIEKEMKRLGS